MRILVNSNDFLTPVASINVMAMVINAANRSGVWPTKVPNFDLIQILIDPLYKASIQALMAADPAAVPIRYSRILLKQKKNYPRLIQFPIRQKFKHSKYLHIPANNECNKFTDGNIAVHISRT